MFSTYALLHAWDDSVEKTLGMDGDLGGHVLDLSKE